MLWNETMEQKVIGIHIPDYILEILTQDITASFLRMSVIKDGESYRFQYSQGDYHRIVTASLSSKERIELLEEMLRLKEHHEDHLIESEWYLLEPELLFRRGNDRMGGNVRILFYPDVRKQSFEKKWVAIVTRLLRASERVEADLLRNLRLPSDSEIDWKAMRMILAKAKSQL